jgi:hypothetical protein
VSVKVKAVIAVEEFNERAFIDAAIEGVSGRTLLGRGEDVGIKAGVNRETEMAVAYGLGRSHVGI